VLWCFRIRAHGILLPKNRVVCDERAAENKEKRKDLRYRSEERTVDGAMSSGRICYEWRNTGSCRFGPRCQYQHVGSGRGGGVAGVGGRGSAASSRSGPSGGGGGGLRNVGSVGVTNVGGGNRGFQGVCHQWQRTGNCRYGKHCKYKHVGTGSQSSPANSRTYTKAIQADLSRFIKHLSVLPPHKLGDELFKSSSLWRRCWLNHDALDGALIGNMMEILAKTPGSSSVEPPDVEKLEDVTRKYLADRTKQGTADDAVLTSVKTVLDALSRSLQFEWTCSQDQVREALSNIIILAESKLRKQHKEHREVSSRLMEAIEVKYNIILRFLFAVSNLPRLSRFIESACIISIGHGETLANQGQRNISGSCNDR